MMDIFFLTNDEVGLNMWRGWTNPDINMREQKQNNFGEWLEWIVLAGMLAGMGYALIQASEQILRQIPPPPPPRLYTHPPPSF